MNKQTKKQEQTHKYGGQLVVAGGEGSWGDGQNE